MRYFPTIKPTIAIATIGIALAGCNHTEPGIEVRTVYVPQPQPCLPADEIPEEPATVGDKLTGDKAKDFDIVAPLAIDLRIGFKAMRAALLACAEG